MPLMIRRGDTTSHGGRVLQGFDGYTVEGRSVAAMGHMVACPRCKGIFLSCREIQVIMLLADRWLMRA